MTPHEQAELARALFEESGDALFLLDPDTDQLLDVNPVALRLTGFSRAEVVQFSATNMFRIEAGGGLQKLRGAFSKTVVFHGQDGYLLRAKDEAAWIPVSLTVSRLHVAPKPLGLIVARDDRERRAALSQARRVEAELRTVLANAPAALWSAERTPTADLSSGWQFRYVSPLLATLGGRPPEFLDHPLKWSEVIHPGDRERYRAAVRRLLTGSDSEIEQLYRVPTAQGTVRWVQDRLQVIRDKSGRPVRLDGCVADVTDQREAEDAVRQSERRFRALVEKGGDGIVLIDDKATILYASPSVRAISGYDPNELVGRDGFGLVVPEELPSAHKLLRDSIKRPGEDIAWRGRMYTADRTVQLIELNLCNRLNDPSVRALVVNYRDVTERIRLEEALRQAAKMEGIGRLAGGIAHDFNNLLTVVLGNLELVRDGGLEEVDVVELLGSAESAAKQAAELTRQMLGFARRQPLQSVVVDLNELVREELKLIRRSIESRIAIEFHPASALRPVFADPIQLQQVLMNLCLNARDAMPDGGTITIRTDNADTPPAAHADGPIKEGYVRLRVQDTGVGMSEEVRANVFEPFFTTKDVGRGTGLGLAVVYGVARQHEGWVECQSELGRGSCFDVFIPYAESGKFPTVKAAASGGGEKGRGELVLIADDEPSVRAVAETGLTHFGYRTLTAQDGAEAVAAYRQRTEPISMVVLDLMMPTMTGRQAYEAIRELDSEVPVLFASAWASSDQLPDPLPPNTGFLNKPYTPTQLNSAIRKLLLNESNHVGNGI
ncbi:MAG: PAS domain S-box protein [Gemmataceae bacterium]